MPYTSSFPESFIGKTLVKPESFKLDCYITDTTGAHKWRLKHFQACCESVDFIDSHGTWPTGPILSAGMTEGRDKPAFLADREFDYNYSYTWTTVTLSDGRDTITLAYFGSSNGYYSEDVTLEYWMENETK